jgi:hypothetical protein
MTEQEMAGLAGGKKALILDPKDNVAVALADLDSGDECQVTEDGGARYIFQVTESIPFGHKFALVALNQDDPVYKYGEEIGKMKTPLQKGGWVHVHNMYCDRGMK